MARVSAVVMEVGVAGGGGKYFHTLRVMVTSDSVTIIIHFPRPAPRPPTTDRGPQRGLK